jgi:hypothetical protein
MPHVRFVQAQLHPESQEKDLLEQPWEVYVAQQHRLDEKTLAEWKLYFIGRINRALAGADLAPSDLRLRKDKAVVVDGLHRASIAHVIHGRVKAWINA